MGGLFSSSKNETIGSRQSSVAQSYPYSNSGYQVRPAQVNIPISSSNYHYWQESQNATPRRYYENYGQAVSYQSRNFEDLPIGGRKPAVRQIEAPERSTKREIFDIPSFYRSSITTTTELTQYDWEYSRVNSMITNKRNFKVDKIVKIENPFLEKAYELKKAQKLEEYGNVEERLLFHGTKSSNVDTIFGKNFNWRLCKAHKYGKGVSFSPNSTYASNYSDEHVYSKIMIVAKVLIGRSCMGHENMNLPDEGCDTSQKGLDGIVIVKYEDNEFCPVYKITYHLINENVGKGNRYRRQGWRQQVIVDYAFDDY